MTTKVTNIIIPDRFRQEYGNVQELADSIKRYGLIHPPLVDISPDGKITLVAGGRRMQAVKLLGLEEIPVTDRANMTLMEQKEVEFEENHKRLDTTWWEDALAVAEMHDLKRAEFGTKLRGPSDESNIEGWTQDKMAAFAGESVGHISYLLRIAKMLRSTPKVNEAGEPNGIWACTGYKDAVRFLIATTTGQKASEEINRRRAVLEAATQSTESPESPAPLVSPDESNQASKPPIENTAVINGTPKDYLTCNFKDDLIEDSASCIVALDPPKVAWPIIKQHLRQSNGYAVLWFTSFSDWESYHRSLDGQVFRMGYPLVWNRIKATDKSEWPHASTATYGLVVSKGLHSEVEKPAPSVVAALPDTPDYLPVQVLDFSINQFTNDGMAVNCLWGVDPVDVASLARVPVFYEGDAEKYDRAVKKLTLYYQETVPNIRVITRQQAIEELNKYNCL